MSSLERKIITRRIIRSYFSSVISISMVLFIIGFAGFLAINAGTVADYFKESITFSVIFDSSVSNEQAEQVKKKLSERAYVKEISVVSREQGVKEMKQLLGPDFLDVFQVNPIPVSLELHLGAAYIDSVHINSIMAEIGKIPEVEDITYHESLVSVLNTNMDRIMMIMVIVGACLLLISTALIANTVRLNIFAKRFTIHPMALVGATKHFITGPFATQAFFQGFFAGLIADCALVLTLQAIRNRFHIFFEVFDSSFLPYVLGGVIVAGILLCVISTVVVVRSQVTLSRDALYY